MGDVLNFADALKQSKCPRDDCVRYALLWVAAIDGDVHPSEIAWVKQNLEARPEELPLHTIIDAIGQRNPRVDALAFGFLRKLLDQDDRAVVLELAVGIAIVDGRIAHSEIHALRFISDALGFSPREFAQIYRQEANADLPRPADLSDPVFWEMSERATRERAEARRENSGSGGGGDSDRSSKRSGGAFGEVGAREALATLGLAGDATIHEIREAYRRLAAVHHPDKFVAQGKPATEAASRTFQRIKAAYDLLCAQRQA